MKVLLAEDDNTTRFMLESLLRKWGYDVVTASDGEEAWRILSMESPPLLALVDWLMPGMDGIEICSKVRERNYKNGKYQYIILLTVQNEAEDVIRGLESGADDYVIKPFNTQELKMRLQVGRRIINLQEKLAFSASHDYLTQLLNRRALFSRLSQEISRAERSESSFVLALLDLDHFKNVNDTFGHLAGDEVLRIIARDITSHIRPYDVVGRYGGEEFLVLLPDATIEEAFSVMERIRLNFAEKACEVRGHEIQVSVSIGLVNYRQGMTVDELISIADGALYNAKENGRNKVCCDVMEEWFSN